MTFLYSSPTLTVPCLLCGSLWCLGGVGSSEEPCPGLLSPPLSDRTLMQRRVTTMGLSISEVHLQKMTIQYMGVGHRSCGWEGHESCQQSSEGLPGLGAARTSSLGTFWTGHHEVLSFLNDLSHSILSLPFLSHLELAWVDVTRAVGSVPLQSFQARGRSYLQSPGGLSLPV